MFLQVSVSLLRGVRMMHCTGSPNLPPRHGTSLYSPSSCLVPLQTWVLTVQGPLPVMALAGDIWWPSLETCSNFGVPHADICWLLRQLRLVQAGGRILLECFLVVIFIHLKQTLKLPKCILLTVNVTKSLP